AGAGPAEADDPAEVAEPVGGTESVAAGDAALFEVPPGTAHAVRNEGVDEIVLVALSSRADPASRPADPPLLTPRPAVPAAPPPSGSDRGGPPPPHAEAAPPATDDARVRVRRRDRAKEEAWIRRYLHAAPWGVFAFSDGAEVYANANLFVYDEEAHALYLHTARTGRTRPGVGQTPRQVVLYTGAMGRLLPADEALEFSVEYSGVVVFGSLRVVDDPGESERALQKLLDKYAPHLRPGRDYRPIAPEELKRTAVYRIDIEAWSGKEKAVAPDHPGAYGLPGPPIPFEVDAS
ncbi:MAG: hypothetical protein D6701_06170, partial [Gemmatimonadetes bacterium]